jgi:hypothetical protein
MMFIADKPSIGSGRSLQNRPIASKALKKVLEHATVSVRFRLFEAAEKENSNVVNSTNSHYRQVGPVQMQKNITKE